MKTTIGAVLAALFLSYGAMAEQRIGPFLTGMAGVGDNSGSAFGAGAKYEWLFSDSFGLDLHAGYLQDSDADMGIFPLEFGPVFVIPLSSLAINLGAGGCYAIPTESEIDRLLGFMPRQVSVVLFPIAWNGSPRRNTSKWKATATPAGITG